jgi:hypothetical protein
MWQLDSHGNYWLFWKTNATHITFETHVKTRGYVGFGLSSNGKMFPSDVVVGWVDNNGMTHFKVCMLYFVCNLDIPHITELFCWSGLRRRSWFRISSIRFSSTYSYNKKSHNIPYDSHLYHISSVYYQGI